MVNQPEGSNSSPLNSKSSLTFHTLATSCCNVLQDWQCYVFFIIIWSQNKDLSYALFPVAMRNNTGKFWQRSYSNGTGTISYPFYTRLCKPLTWYMAIQIVQQSIRNSTLVWMETGVSQNMRNSWWLNCYDDWCWLHPNTTIHKQLFQRPGRMEKPSFRKILDQDWSWWSHHPTVQFWIGLEMGV